jgi:hypothetical protein
MADNWRSVFKGTIEERPVEAAIYEEGGFRVRTTQFADDLGHAYKDDFGGTTVIGPSEKGREIDIDSESLEGICTQLVCQGFSYEAASEIAEKLRSASFQKSSPNEPALKDIHPLPGSPEAKSLGCKCSSILGEEGKPLFVMTKGCPIENHR